MSLANLRDWLPDFLRGNRIRDTAANPHLTEPQAGTQRGERGPGGPTPTIHGYDTECDKCRAVFKSDEDVWSNYEALNRTHDQLMLVQNQCGYYPPWFCSEEYQKEVIADLTLS